MLHKSLLIKVNSFKILSNGLLPLLLVCALMLSLNSKTLAQNKTYEFDHFTTNEGLSNGYVYCILRDSKGFIWVGTPNGLNRFDGISFKSYYFSIKDTNSISSNGATSLSEDSIGNIWVMTTNGICIFDRKKDNFSRKEIKVNGKKINDNFINTCFIDSKGFLWFGTPNGILRFKLYNNPETSKNIINAEQYLLNENDVDNVHKNNIYSIVEDANKCIWIASFSNSLFYFNNQQNKFLPHLINHPDVNKFSNCHKVLMKDRKGDFYIAIETNVVDVLLLFKCQMCTICM